MSGKAREPEFGGEPGAASLEAAGLFVAATQGLVADLRAIQWDVGQPVVQLISRAVICRQHDYLAVAADMARQRRGWAIVPLLRPACEELIWLTVLADVDDEARERIVVSLGALDLTRDLRAQDDYLGRPAMLDLGYPRGLFDDADERRRRATTALAAAFRGLGFPLGRNQYVPSVAALADRAGLRRLYDFIYHASSTTVHFKPGQLLRGIWGQAGALRVDLAPVEARLADFGLYWAVRLAFETFIVALPLTGRDADTVGLDPDAIERAGKKLSGGVRPFVLPDELIWPTPS